MKKILILTSVVALAAGCSSYHRDQTAYNNPNPYGTGPYVAPNQQGAGAAALTGHGGVNEPGYGTTQYNPMGAPAPAPYEQGGTVAASSGQLSSHDTTFVNQAAEHGQAEVRLGQLFVQNAQNQSLKDYGQRLIDDHNRLNQQLTQLAAQKGVTVPTAVDMHRQRELDHLASLSGKDFDEKALKDSIRDHERDIRTFQDAAQNSQDPDVKAFAQQALPILQDHLNQARQLEKTLNSSST